MTDKESHDQSDREVQSIPKEEQDLSIEEAYDVESTWSSGARPDPPSQHHSHQHYGGSASGRVPDQDSIDASSEDPRGTDEGYVYSGYDSPAATRIGKPNESDDDEVKRLRELNEGRHRSDGQHSVREARRDKQRIPKAICQSLPLADHEEEKIISVVNRLEFEDFGSQKSISHVTLGVVAVLIDEVLRDPVGFEETIMRTDEFRAAKDSVDMSMADLATVKEKVRQALDEGDVRIPKGSPLERRDPVLPDPQPISGRSDAFWEQAPADYWENVARQWGRVPGAVKSAIPDKHRDRVRHLRKWEPWTTEEAPNSESNNSEDPPDTPIGDDNSEEMDLDELDQAVEEVLDNYDEDETDDRSD